MESYPLSVPRLIERPRVLQTLQQGLETCHILLVAPAGYGKSVALRTLAAERPNSHLVGLTIADQDPVVLEARLNPLLKTNHTIIVDDVHLLEDSDEACQWLQQQLQQPEPRLLLAGRQIPFQCDSLIVSGQVSILTKDLLAFSSDETTLLINVASEKIRAWAKRVNGWPLALSLLSRLPNIDTPWLAAEKQLFAYLTETTFAQLPKQLRYFMQVTAVPLHFNEVLVAALWQGGGKAETWLNEIKRRNLYLQPAQEAGWLCYHDLIREFLLQQNEVSLKTTAELSVAWFEKQGDLSMAIEQALDSNLKAKAADLLTKLNLSQFHSNSSYLTYRRWVTALDDEALATNPILLVRLSNVTSMLADYQDEAWLHTRRAIDLAESSRDIDAGFLAKINLALLFYKTGDLEQAHQTIKPILDDPACEGYPRLFGLRIATLILGELAHFSETAPYFAEAITLAQTLGKHNEPMMNRANRAHLLLIPLGQFEWAQREFEMVLHHFADKPGWYSQYLIGWCELQTAQGNWSRLTKAVKDIEMTLNQVEKPSQYTLSWFHFYRVILQIIEGDEQSVQSALKAYQSYIAQNPADQVYLAWLKTWHLRRQGYWKAIIDYANKFLRQPYQTVYCRAWLALERDIAQGMRKITHPSTDFALHEETRNFILWRARPHLVRLRALLAIVCWHQDNQRWRRHFRSAMRSLRQPGYEYLLTQRDPELGVYFWTVAISAGIYLDEAFVALRQIGQYKPLLNLLSSEQPTVRIRGAVALAKIGNERAIPALITTLEQEEDSEARDSFEWAITQLEDQPPPQLTIRLMGDFVLYRGKDEITPDRWPRPIVLRLFQYFVLHAGRPLTKDRILDDLWPGTPPNKAWKTFRTVYSSLRQVLEPNRRPKIANRYFEVGNETYTFDPHHLADIDLARFIKVVDGTLKQFDTKLTPTADAAFFDLLEAYTPILPSMSYEDWLLESREQAQALYEAGTLYAAQVYLAQGNNAIAATWAKRVCHVAPWREEAYQMLMRAQARQGQRSLALRTFDEAVAALKQELDITPSPLT
ncbi:MAG: BTAD domain-containing putative transcriptional regulator [Chloroflexota bacterium]